MSALHMSIRSSANGLLHCATVPGPSLFAPLADASIAGNRCTQCAALACKLLSTIEPHAHAQLPAPCKYSISSLGEARHRRRTRRQAGRARAAPARGHAAAAAVRAAVAAARLPRFLGIGL